MKLLHAPFVPPRKQRATIPALALLALQVFCCRRRLAEAFVSPPPPPFCALRRRPPAPALLLGASSSSSGAAALRDLLGDCLVRLPRALAQNRIRREEERRATQALGGLQNELARTHTTHKQLVATHAEKARSRNQLRKQAEVWNKRGFRAYFIRWDQRLSSHAWDRSYCLQEEAEVIDRWIDRHQADTIDPVCRRIEVLVKEIPVAEKNQKEARARLAKSTQEVDDLLSRLDWKNIRETALRCVAQVVSKVLSQWQGKANLEAALGRMEARVLDLEESAEVSVEMARLAVRTQTRPPPSCGTAEPSSDIELQFRALEGASDTAAADGKADREGIRGGLRW
jgi:hypothetical protein